LQAFDEHATPFAFFTSTLQSTLQPPHLSIVDVGVSHPVFPDWQWLKPGEQVQLHDPASHEGAPLVLEHWTPQPPQLSTFVWASRHWPSQHTGLEPEQTLPHALQLNGSVRTSTQKSPQQRSPALHPQAGRRALLVVVAVPVVEARHALVPGLIAERRAVRVAVRIRLAARRALVVRHAVASGRARVCRLRHTLDAPAGDALRKRRVALAVDGADAAWRASVLGWSRRRSRAVRLGRGVGPKLRRFDAQDAGTRRAEGDESQHTNEGLGASSAHRATILDEA
jgi:hypothetical protein